jgi:hypothetical protein
LNGSITQYTAGSNGNRSKIDGHVKQQQRIHQTLTDELTRRTSSGGSRSWPGGSLNPVDESRSWTGVGEEGNDDDEEEEEEDDVKEMKGNSLVNNAGKNNFDHRYKSVSQQNQPDEEEEEEEDSFVSSSSGSAGPPFSDQDQVHV